MHENFFFFRFISDKTAWDPNIIYQQSVSNFLTCWKIPTTRPDITHVWPTHQTSLVAKKDLHIFMSDPSSQNTCSAPCTTIGEIRETGYSLVFRAAFWWLCHVKINLSLWILVVLFCFDLGFRKVFLYFNTNLLPSCMSYMEARAEMPCLSAHSLGSKGFWSCTSATSLPPRVGLEPAKDVVEQ